MSQTPESRSHKAGITRLRHPLHLFPGRYTRPGTAPGDLTVPEGEERPPAVLTLFDYDADDYIEKAFCTLEEARDYFDSPRTTWLHVS